MRDGAITSLTNPTNEAYAYHVSGRATGRPGWVCVSYHEFQDGLRVVIASTWSLNCDSGCGTQTVRQDYVVDERGLPGPAVIGDIRVATH